jgi:predicted O-methyltransferase YrrM
MESKKLSKADKILQKIEQSSKSQFLPIIGPEKGMVLIDAMHEFKPKRILEIGTLIGYSLILMGKELPSESEIISIEIHSNEAETARKNALQSEILPKIQVIVGDAIKIIPKIGGEFDMVFIDADKTEYLQYLKLVEEKLYKGSVVIADNAGIFADQMRDYLDYVRSSGKYKSRYHDFDSDGVEVSVKI